MRSVQIIMEDQEDTNMSPNNSSKGSNHRKYGRPSANYHEVTERGRKKAINDNGKTSSVLGIKISEKTKNVLRILIPALLFLAFMAWY